MSETSGPYDFVYVHTDIPEGMTIRAWRAQRAEERKRQAARQGASQRWPLGALASIARLRLPTRGVFWQGEVRHSSGAHGSITS